MQRQNNNTPIYKDKPKQELLRKVIRSYHSFNLLFNLLMRNHAEADKARHL